MNAEVDSAEILNLIHGHLDRSWHAVTQDELVIKKIAFGFINRNYVIERRDGQKVLLKLYGGNVAADEADITLSMEQEILTCATWSRIGSGPKLLAVFPGGRMEEFIESHTIIPSEYQDPGIRRQLAKAIATFHSLDLPFRRPAFDFPRLLMRMFRDFVSHEKERIIRNPVFKEKNVDISRLANYDFASDLKWLKVALTEEHNRMVYTHGDLHGHNILIRSKDGTPVLIDLQESGYNWRGRDLGLFLISSVIDMSSMSVARFPFPSPEYCFAFFDDYMEQIQELALFPDIDRKGRDSNEHLMMETLMGGMASVMYVILLIMNRHEKMMTATPDLAVSTNA